jgi:biopolymer transport protein ExbD
MAARTDDGDDDGAELHEINVTPFIDVMLVLLIIFMVAAPLSTVDVAVDLPVSTAKPQPRPDKPLFLTIKADLSLAIGNDPIPKGQLTQAIDAATETDRQKRIFLRADKTVPYGELMIVMNLLRAGGYLKLALVGLEGTEVGPSPALGETPAPVANPNPPPSGAAAQPPPHP